MGDWIADLDALTVGLIIMGVGLALGVLCDLIIYRLLKARATRANWSPGRHVAGAFRGIPTSTGALIALHYALSYQTLPRAWEMFISDTYRVVAIFVATAYGARLLGRLVRVYTFRDDSRLPATTIYVNLVRSVVWVLGAVGILGALGVSITPLLTALGVGGLAVGLALQPTLENAFSGVQILSSLEVEPGNVIRLDTGEEGTVLDVTWRNTTILTAVNDVVVVPNALLGRSRLTNMSALQSEHVLTIPVTVSPASDAALVDRVMSEVAQEVAQEVDGALPDEPAVVRIMGLGPAGLQVNAAISVNTYQDRPLVRHEYLKRVQARLIAEGVEFTASGPASAAPASVVSPGRLS